MRFLDVPAFRKLWDVCDANAFVHEFAVFVRYLYFEQAAMYNLPVSPDGERMVAIHALDDQFVNVVTWRYFMRARREIRYEADEALLARLEKTLRFRDSCRKRLHRYERGGWRTWWRDMLKCRLVYRYMRQTAMVLSRQELWASMIALFVQKGFGTADDFARIIQAEK